MEEPIERIIFYDEDTEQSFTFDWPLNLYLGGPRPGTIDGQYVPSEILITILNYAVQPSSLARHLGPNPIDSHSAQLLRDIWQFRVLTRQFKACVEETARGQVLPSVELRCEAWIDEAHFRVSTYTFLHWDVERPERARFKEIRQLEFDIPAFEDDSLSRRGQCWRAKLCGIEIKKPIVPVHTQEEEHPSRRISLSGFDLIKDVLTFKLGRWDKREYDRILHVKEYVCSIPTARESGLIFHHL